MIGLSMGMSQHFEQEPEYKRDQRRVSWAPNKEHSSTMAKLYRTQDNLVIDVQLDTMHNDLSQDEMSYTACIQGKGKTAPFWYVSECNLGPQHPPIQWVLKKGGKTINNDLSLDARLGLQLGFDFLAATAKAVGRANLTNSLVKSSADHIVSFYAERYGTKDIAELAKKLQENNKVKGGDTDRYIIPFLVDRRYNNGDVSLTIIPVQKKITLCSVEKSQASTYKLHTPISDTTLVNIMSNVYYAMNMKLNQKLMVALQKSRNPSV